MDDRLLENDIRVELSDGGSCQKVASVEIARARFEDEKARVLREMTKEVSIPGFRKGKVPVEVVERRFADEIQSEALRSILPLAYSHVLSAHELDPIGDPEFQDVKLEQDKPLAFKVCVEVMPKLAIADYRGVAAPAEANPVTDEEIEAVLGNLRERAADLAPVDRAAAAGDVLTIEYAPVGADGTIDEKERAKDFHVQLGAGRIFPAFEEALTGKKANESGRVDIAYPADFEPKNLAGRTVTYEFVVNEVRERRLPELDDALASRIDERFATLAALREDVRARLAGEKEKETQRRREEKAIDLIIERNPFDIPASMRERFKKELYAEDDERRKAVGVGPEEDAGRKAQMEEFFDRVAERNIKRYFIMDYIAEKEGVEVSREEIDGELAAIAAENGRPVEELRKYLERDPDRLTHLRARLRERKLFTIILGAS
jgi:trigger factor